MRDRRTGGRADGRAVGQRGSGEAGKEERVVDQAPQFDLLSSLPAYPPTRLPVLDERSRGTRFIALPVSSVLNTPASTGMGFWSINPYVGCEFGCTYCYARDTHRWVMERAVGRTGGQVDGRTGGRVISNGEAVKEDDVASDRLSAHPPVRLPPEEAFEKEILIKSEVAEVLARTLKPAKIAGNSLVIGTATDPYQPAERQFRLTRRILEVLGAYHGLSIGIITKSSLITRDLDLLQALSRHNEVTVNISLATADARLARRLELRSPVPAARLRALRRLSEGGIHAGLLVAPIVPGVTDDWAGLARLMEAAKEFPDLAERYRRHYAGKDHVSQSYQDALSRRLRLLQQAYGFPVDEGIRRRRQLEGRAPQKDASALEEQAVLL